MTEQPMLSRTAKTKELRTPVIWALICVVLIPSLYAMGAISIETVNMLGRYMAFAILAIGLDLLWGYGGILSLCQATFFCFGSYAMGMYLAHHGGPEGIVDSNGWKIPACLYFVYPGEVGQTEADWTVPFFWKPFWNLFLTILLGLLIPIAAAFTLGYFVFRSRVRGVYFAILTQAIAVAALMIFTKNEMLLGGTNGLSRFHHFIFGNHEQIEITVVTEEDLKKVEEALPEFRKIYTQIVAKSMSRADAAKMLEQELSGDFAQLTKKVGDLPPEVATSLEIVVVKMHGAVEALQGEDNATQVRSAMDELGLALYQASSTVELSAHSEEVVKKIDEGLEMLHKKQARIVAKSMSDADATEMLEKELAGDLEQLNKAVGYLPSKVKSSLGKVSNTLEVSVDALKLEDGRIAGNPLMEKAIRVREALHELKLALDEADKAVKLSSPPEENLEKIEEGLDKLRKTRDEIEGHSIVSLERSMSDVNATEKLVQELQGDWVQLTKKDNNQSEEDEYLPKQVKVALQKVVDKVNGAVEAFVMKEKATQVRTALDELGLALDETSTAVSTTLKVRPQRLEEVKLALERHRGEKRATKTISLYPKLYRLSSGGMAEENASSSEPGGIVLTPLFDLQDDDDRSYWLVLDQRDVDDEWHVALNDQRLGILQPGPAAQVTSFTVPRDALKGSGNKLTIRPASPNSRDEVVVGRIRLLAVEVPALGGTLEQNGENFLSVPEFGVNLDKDYNELVIHAEPGDADKNVKLGDWANVKYLGSVLTDDSVNLILYLLTVLALFGAYFLCRWIVRSRLGRVLLAIRDDEGTLRFFGYHPHVYKLFAFCVAAGLAGLAGMLYVPQMKITTPSDMEAYKSILIVVWVAVGGRGTLSGAIIGALTVNLLYNYLTSDHDFLLFTWKSDYWPFVLGGLFVSVVLFLPRGLMSLPEKLNLSQKFAKLRSKRKTGKQP